MCISPLHKVNQGQTFSQDYQFFLILRKSVFITISKESHYIEQEKCANFQIDKTLSSEVLGFSSDYSGKNETSHYLHAQGIFTIFLPIAFSFQSIGFVVLHLSTTVISDHCIS